MKRSRIGRRAAVAVAVVAVVTVGPALAASAGFSATSMAAHTLTSATLAPVSGLSVTTGCSLTLEPKADLSWTATPSTFASGYQVERWSGSVLEQVTSVTPRSTTTLTQTGLRTGISYTWKVRAYHQLWTSSHLSVTGSTPGLCL